jgi:hypothetical protein
MNLKQIFNNLIKSRYLIFYVFLILLIFYYLPFLKYSGIVWGHDLIYHLSRAVGAYDQLKLGIFPSKVMGGFYGGYGYAVGIFYPTGLIYLMSFLLYFGLDVVNSYQIWAVIITLFTMISMYYSSIKIIPSKKFALIATFIYTFSVYRNYTDLIDRAALGEYIVFIFLPIVFSSIYLIVHKKENQWFWLSVGMVGILTSHLISTIWVILLLVIYTLIYNKDVFQTKTLITIVKAALFTILISIYYWLPMLEMMASDEFRYHHPWTKLSDNIITEWNKFFFIDPSINQFPHGIETWLLILLVITLITQFKKIIHHPFLKFSLIILIFLFIFISNIIPVEYLSIFNFMQFPWRLYLFITYFLCIIVAYYITQLKLNTQVILMSLIVVVTYTGYVRGFDQLYKSRQETIYYSFPRYQVEHYYGEFLPWWADMDYLIENVDPYSILISNPIDLTYEKKTTTFDIYFNQNEYTHTTLEIPLIYYIGYSAYLTSGDTTVLLPIERTETSLMSINLQEYKEGKIHFYYQGTRIQKISSYISVLTGFLLILFYGLKWLMQFPTVKKLIPHLNKTNLK